MTKRISYRISDARAQLLAVRAWMGTFFPKAQGIDADEAQDLVERAGSSCIVLTGIYTVDWPKKCTIACYFPTVACGTCPHDGAKPKKISEPDEPEEQLDLTGVQVFLQRFTLHLPPKKVKPVFQSWHETRDELYLVAPPTRGRRASVEPRAWRM